MVHFLLKAKTTHALLLAGNALLFLFAYSNYAGRFNVPPPKPLIDPIGYGEKIDQQVLDRLTAFAPGKGVIFLAFFDPARRSPSIEYLDLLAQRIPAQELGVIAVSHLTEQQVKRFPGWEGSTIPYLPDVSLAIYSRSLRWCNLIRAGTFHRLIH